MRKIIDKKKSKKTGGGRRECESLIFSRISVAWERSARSSNGRYVDARRAISGTVDSSAMKQCKRVLVVWLFCLFFCFFCCLVDRKSCGAHHQRLRRDIIQTFPPANTQKLCEPSHIYTTLGALFFFLVFLKAELAVSMKIGMARCFFLRLLSSHRVGSRLFTHSSRKGEHN